MSLTRDVTGRVIHLLSSCGQEFTTGQVIAQSHQKILGSEFESSLLLSFFHLLELPFRLPKNTRNT
jgi:hypothetical protein